MGNQTRRLDNSHSASAASPARAASEVREVLSQRFEILKSIMESETRLVYLARRLEPESPVYPSFVPLRLKVLPPSAASNERQVELFKLEACAAAMLNNKSIIQTSEAEEVDGIHFCVVEDRPAAVTLRDILDRDGSLDIERAVNIAEQVACALDYAHGLGVLHLNLQPESLLIDSDGTVLVADFGIESQAGLLWAHQERSHLCAAHYISPEQVQCNQVDQRTDLYSLGIIFYEMLSGRVPFDSEDRFLTKLSHLREMPQPPHLFRPELPKPLSWVILDLLKKSPDERLGSAQAFKVTLDQAMKVDLHSPGITGVSELNLGPDDSRPNEESLGFEHENAALSKDEAATSALAPLDTQKLDEEPAELIAVKDSGVLKSHSQRGSLEDQRMVILSKPSSARALPRRALWLLLIAILGISAILLARRANHVGNKVEPDAQASSADDKPGEARGAASEKPSTSSEKVLRGTGERQPAINQRPGRESGPRLPKEPAQLARVVTANAVPRSSISSPALLPPPPVSLPASIQASLPDSKTETGLSIPVPARAPDVAEQPKRADSSPPKIVRRSGDVLQNSAIFSALPAYPEAAKALHVTGSVTVEVTVDEEGNVIAARYISGPELLREAALDAARRWKWMPARIDRARVKVVGTLTFRFH